MAELPRYLGGHGYAPSGLPELRAAIARWFTGRGLPTDPEQVVVTAGVGLPASVAAFDVTGVRVGFGYPAFDSFLGGATVAGTRF